METEELREKLLAALPTPFAVKDRNLIVDDVIRTIASHAPQPTSTEVASLVKAATDAFVILEGLRLAVVWEIAPPIMREIVRLTESFPSALKPFEKP